jgi:G6PDH family F420-dependent oxidoreductase
VSGTGPRLQLGYWLSSEEHPPQALVANAVAAERAGIATAMISDHFHPWTPEQGQSPFVWAVLGGIAQATHRLRIGTGVTAPMLRLHPAVVAHATATVATLMPGRFFLGLGTGERLNEQVTGERWPTPAERRDRLAEAVDVIRRLLAGEEVSFRGRHVTVEHAQLYTRPAEPPPVVIAATGRRGATLAGEHGDGMVAVRADPALVDAFESSGGAGKPVLGQIHVCWAADPAQARRTALRYWPIAALAGRSRVELARPAEFAALSGLVREDDIARTVVCGPDPQPYLDAITSYAAAGFTELYLHQIGPDQAGFLRFYAEHLAPALRPPQPVDAISHGPGAS